jgi:hypothetical protein
MTSPPFFLSAVALRVPAFILVNKTPSKMVGSSSMGSLYTYPKVLFSFWVNCRPARVALRFCSVLTVLTAQGKLYEGYFGKYWCHNNESFILDLHCGVQYWRCWAVCLPSALPTPSYEPSIIVIDQLPLFRWLLAVPTIFRVIPSTPR